MGYVALLVLVGWASMRVHHEVFPRAVVDFTIAHRHGVADLMLVLSFIGALTAPGARSDTRVTPERQV